MLKKVDQPAVAANPDSKQPSLLVHAPSLQMLSHTIHDFLTRSLVDLNSDVIWKENIWDFKFSSVFWRIYKC